MPQNRDQDILQEKQMDRALVVTAPRELGFENVPHRPPGDGEVRVRTLYSGVSAGTELSQYRGTSPFMNKQWDSDARMFRAGGQPSWTFPVRNLGYEEVGEIVEIGSSVEGLEIGQRVFGTWGHRTGHTLDAADARARLMPEGGDPRMGIFSHIGAVALNGVHDARIRLGDLVVVFGLGVPGQIVAQAARASGARVIGVDPSANRRERFLALGGLRALDPTDAPVSDIIKGETGGRGADICIEVSGAPSALAEAMRTVAYASRVVAMGFFQGELRGIHLGDEFHHNRIELISSQISGVAPDASHRWSKLRLWQQAVALQHEGVLHLVPLITDTVPFDEAPDLFMRLDKGDPAVLQAVLAFGDAP
jgi:2-desacetyl-2-hydroxyethyl bacteriochlorophyllide A dehydrogenase